MVFWNVIVWAACCVLPGHLLETCARLRRTVYAVVDFPWESADGWCDCLVAVSWLVRGRTYWLGPVCRPPPCSFVAFLREAGAFRLAACVPPYGEITGSGLDLALTCERIPRCGQFVDCFGLLFW